VTRWLGYIAMSLDGRIADRDHGLGWLEAFAGDGSEDFGYADFYAGIDALVMGRTTHDIVAGQADWPYAGKPCFVVTRRPLESGHTGTVAVPPDFPALKARIAAEGHGAVWIVGGGATQRAALDAGMLDSLRLFVMPVVLGGGPPVFGEGVPSPAALTGCRTWPQGIVELEYAFAQGTAASPPEAAE
jgi:dihydrofolate reductase